MSEPLKEQWVHDLANAYAPWVMAIHKHVRLGNMRLERYERTDLPFGAGQSLYVPTGRKRWPKMEARK